VRQLVCVETGRVEAVGTLVPRLADGDILVKMAACGICGTDVMKVYDRSVNKPVQIGHEIVGTVLEGAGRLKVGQRVAVAHHAPDYDSHYTLRGSETQDPTFKSSNIDPGGFAELIRVPAELVPHTVHAVPDDMPDMRAVFMEPLACCLRALDRVPVCQGDTVLVVGVGAIGMLFVPVLNDLGALVLAADVRDDRLREAKSWGVSSALFVGKDDIATETKRVSASRGADVVILTAVNAVTLKLAMAAVRDGGWIIPFGVKPDTVLPFDFWQIYRREISVVTSYSATPAGLKRAMGFLACPGFEFEKLVSHVLPLASAQEGFTLLHAAKASKVVVVPLPLKDFR
jgi:L-iditol 2-dehydrogenase